MQTQSSSLVLTKENQNRIQLMMEYAAKAKSEGVAWMCDLLLQHKLPEELALQVAEVCHQADLPRRGIEILLKSLGKASPKSASPQVLISLALLHGMLGDEKTAESFLKVAAGRDAIDHQVYLKISAWIGIGSWNFERSLRSLQELRKLSSSIEDQKTYSLSLIKSYIREGTQGSLREAKSLLESCLSENSDQDRKNMVRAKVLLLNLEWDFIHFRDSRRCLENAKKIQHEFPQFGGPILNAWIHLLEVRSNGVRSDSFERIQELRKIAVTSKQPHWSLEIDYLTCLILNETAATQRLWYGSPFAEVRKTIRNLNPSLPQQKDPSITFLIDPEKGIQPQTPQSGDPVLDLVRGTFRLNKEIPFLKAGQSADRILKLFTSDLYRTLRIEEIFSHLYPTESFEIGKSEMRIHAQVSRARRILGNTTQSLSIEPDADGAGYRWVVHSPVYVRISNPEEVRVLKWQSGSQTPTSTPQSKGSRTPARSEYELEQLKASMSDTQSLFSAVDAAKIWNVSPRTANSRIQEALIAKLIQKYGNGPKTRYRVA